jgi:MFS family permease
MTWTILLYAVASGLCALSHTWQELAFYRFLVGLGIGGEMGAGAIFLSEWFVGKNRYRALGLMNGSICAGYMLSAVANFVLGHAGWRYVFLCGLVPALLAIYVRLQLSDPIPKQVDENEQGNFSPFKYLFSLHLKKSLVVLALASVAMINWWAVLSWVPAWINQLTGGLAVTERSAVSFTMYMGSSADLRYCRFCGGAVLLPSHLQAAWCSIC